MKLCIFQQAYRDMEIHSYPTKTKRLCSQTLEQWRWHPWLHWQDHTQHLGYLADRPRMTKSGRCVVLWETLQVSKLKALPCHQKELPVCRLHRKARKMLGRFSARKGSAVVVNKCPWEQLISPFKHRGESNSKLNRQDVEMFSLKIRHIKISTLMDKVEKNLNWVYVRV